MEAMYVGKPEDDPADFSNFEEWFKDVYPDNLLLNNEKTHDTFYDKLLSQVGARVQLKIWGLVKLC